MSVPLGIRGPGLKKTSRGTSPPAPGSCSTSVEQGIERTIGGRRFIASAGAIDAIPRAAPITKFDHEWLDFTLIRCSLGACPRAEQ